MQAFPPSPGNSSCGVSDGPSQRVCPYQVQRLAQTALHCSTGCRRCVRKLSSLHCSPFCCTRSAEESAAAECGQASGGMIKRQFSLGGRQALARMYDGLFTNLPCRRAREERPREIPATPAALPRNERSRAAAQSAGGYSEASQSVRSTGSAHSGGAPRSRSRPMTGGVATGGSTCFGKEGATETATATTIPTTSERGRSKTRASSWRWRGSKYNHFQIKSIV